MVGLQFGSFGWQIHVGTIAGAGHLLRRLSFGLWVVREGVTAAGPPIDLFASYFPAICELDASAGCMGDQRSVLQLGASQSVCLPPVLFDKELPL